MRNDQLLGTQLMLLLECIKGQDELIVDEQPRRSESEYSRMADMGVNVSDQVH